jgi:MYXO-CTERM domain-containing protein
MILSRFHIGLAVSAAFVLASPLAQAASFTTGTKGGAAPVNNTQPGLGVNHIVALQGTFPGGEPGSQTQGTVLGEVKMFGGNFAPRGWAFANGQLLPIESNQALFSLYGTTYGGDGETTFALPDLRGRTVIGAGDGVRLGQKGGQNTHTLNDSHLPEHNHGVNVSLPQSSPTGVTTNTGVNPTSALDNHQPYLALNMGINFEFGTFELGLTTDLARIRIHPSNYPINGVSDADGSIVSLVTNTALFSLIGTTYDGDGQTTFGLPNLDGRNAVHEGRGPTLSDRRLGQTFSGDNIVLTESHLPSHDHTRDPLDPFDTVIHHTGGGNPADNMQPGQVLNYIVNLSGEFPDAGDTLGSPFIGEIALIANNRAPNGWAFADGQLLSIDQNQALFSYLGTTFGGDGRTTFALPDLRGRVPVHVGSGPGLEPIALGQEFGTEDFLVTLNSMPAHDHDYKIIPTPTAGLAGLIGFGLLGAMRRRRESA